MQAPKPVKRKADDEQVDEPAAKKDKKDKKKKHKSAEQADDE